MAQIPEEVRAAREKREGPIVLTTVGEKALPNAIYATCVSLFDEETLVVADNYFDKTRHNLRAGSKGSLLFITAEGKSYQLKGRMEYHTEGDVFRDMKKWNPEKHPGNAAAALTVEEVYSGSKKLL